MAGIDMSMVPPSYSFSDNLIALVKEKKVPMSRIDDAVRRILRVKFELGLFENPMPDPSVKSKFRQTRICRAALQAARESMTLLKNNGNISAAREEQKSSGHRPDGRFADLAQQRLDVDLAGLRTVALSDGQTDDSAGDRSEDRRAEF